MPAKRLKIGQKLFLMMMVLLPFSNQNLFAESEKSDSTIETKKIKIEAELNYMRHYIWRGAAFGNDNVSQSYLNASYGKWSMNLSVNCNLFPKQLAAEDYTKPTAYDEQDFQLTYADSIHKLLYECNSFTYLYFNQRNCPNTSELNLKLMYPLSDTWTVYTDNVTDVWAYKRLLYSCSGLEANFTALKKLEFTTQFYAAAGNRSFNMAYYDCPKNALNFVGTHIEMSMPVFKNYYLKLFVEYNHYTDKTLIRINERNHTTNYGIGFGKDISFPIKTRLVKK